MNSKNGIIGLLIVAVIVIGAVALLQEANESPLEKAAEDIDDAVDEIADEIDDNNQSFMEQFQF